MSTGTPQVRFKSFEYATQTKWTGARQGVIASSGKPAISASSPPEFKGIPGVWTPEDLFVASIEMCQMATFMSFAARRGIRLKSYESRAQGTLEQDESGYRFTLVTIKPHIVVEEGTDPATVEEAVRNAHTHCLIARSITTKVDVVPEISIT
jgi:organic hydroperoxide reductase OsmC/OhrA